MAALRRLAPAVATVLALAAAAPAAADVLVAAPPPRLPCGKPILLGVWYQAFSGGPRWARLSVRTASGRVLARRSVRATTRWRYWRFPVRCGRTYVARYEAASGTQTFRVRVRPR